MTPPPGSTGRDRFVDWFKGFMILWVIHIHTVFWSGYAYIPETVRQATLLIDVPIFFFISGYVTRPGPFGATLLKTVKQFVRLYGHYLIISFLLLGALLLMRPFWGGGDVGQAADTIFPMTPHGELWKKLRVYGGSLWFLQDYLSMLTLVPILLGVSALARIKYHVLVFVLLFTALFPKEYADRTFLFSTWGNCSFYLVFFMLGALFKEQEGRLKAAPVLVSGLVSVGLSLLVFTSDGGRLILQAYKFPPATQYLIYSLLLVHGFVLLKRVMPGTWYDSSGRLARLLHWCGRNVFTIYLLQGAICSLPYVFLGRLTPVLPPVPLYGVILVFNIALTLAAAYGYRRGQDLVAALLRKAFGSRS